MAIQKASGKFEDRKAGLRSARHFQHVTEAVAGVGGGAGAGGVVRQAKLRGGTDRPEIGDGVAGGNLAFHAGVDHGSGQTREVKKVDDVGLEAIEGRGEKVLYKIAGVLGAHHVFLAGERDAGVMEPLHGDCFEFVICEARFLRLFGCPRRPGHHFDGVTACHQALCNLVRDDLGSGGIGRQELMNGEEDSHGQPPLS